MTQRHLAGRDPRCYLSICIQRGLRPRQPALTGNGGEDDVACERQQLVIALHDACATDGELSCEIVEDICP